MSKTKRERELKQNALDLLDAAGEGDIAKVRELLDSGLDASAVGNIQRTALHEAAQKGRLPVVKLLLERGAAVDAPDYRAYAPLHLAAGWGHQAVVEELVRHGANVNAETCFGAMPLRELVSNTTVAPTACEAIITTLVKAGARITSITREHAPLERAAEVGQVTAVRVLLALGAPPRGRSGMRTPLQQATEQGHAKIVDMLRAAGG